MARSVCIPRWQQNLHVGGEVAALLIQVPLLAELISHKGPLTKRQRKRLKVLAAGTLVIDGVLLLTWARRGGRR